MNYYQYVESGKIVTRDELWDFWSRLNPMHAHDPVEFEMSLSADIGNGVLREVTDKDKQIEEMARIMNKANGRDDDSTYFVQDATDIYNAGYRKASEVAREIIEEIDDLMYHDERGYDDLMDSETVAEIYQEYLACSNYISGIRHRLAELKKKYTEEGK